MKNAEIKDEQRTMDKMDKMDKIRERKSHM
jgi:hypothetical protein